MCRILFVVALGLLMSCQVVVETPADYKMSRTCECLNKYDDRGQLNDEWCMSYLSKDDSETMQRIMKAAKEPGFIPNPCAYKICITEMIDFNDQTNRAYVAAMTYYFESISELRRDFYMCMATDGVSSINCLYFEERVQELSR